MENLFDRRWLLSSTYYSSRMRFSRDYRRNLVDMHIEDWDEKFLSQFDPKKYVELLKVANVTTAMIYANSHVGYCYWPTKIGHMHGGIKGRDILGEVIELCHKEGINVVIYYSLIYNNWAYEKEPSWRIVLADGKTSREVQDRSGRYGVCCPNSGYREFALSQIDELCSNYNFEGIFFDMTFWPGVCYCKSCQERFFKETGEELPKVINWEDPGWVRFQRKREEWLSEFAHLATNKVKSINPNISVEHQFSTCVAAWSLGVTSEISEASDYCGGDFYGGLLQESFICKLYYNLTDNQPFEFMTSRCINLRDHTTTKSKELLEAQVYSALSNGGAFLFIDAIDPIGTLNKKVYETMGNIYNTVRTYEEYIDGKLCQDIGIYFSFESKFDPKDNGRDVLESTHKQPHLDSALGVAKSLISNHIPFGIITKKNLNELSRYKVIILPNILMMDEEEVTAFREYVASGGKLYASYYTSLFDKNGNKREDFMLADVFGVSYTGETQEDVTYIAPCREVLESFGDVSSQYPFTLFSSQIKTNPLKKEEVIATISLPYTNPSDPTRFASIHSDPPGISTEYPAIVRRRFGKGEVVWVAGPLEGVDFDPHRELFIKLIKSLVREGFSFEVDAPKSVEVTMFHQEEAGRYIVNFLNFQHELPNIPIFNIRFGIKTRDKIFSKVVILPEEVPLNFEVRGDYLEVEVPKLDTYLMLGIYYR